MLKEFGHDLKILRESRGISLAEISAQTRINPKFLLNIEDGVFDFQPDTYIRAFLREYARCINENEHKILNDYEKAKSGFYARKSKGKADLMAEKKIKAEGTVIQPRDEITYAEKTEEKFSDKKISSESVATTLDQNRSYSSPPKSFFSKTYTQKFILAIIIIFIVAGSVYLLFFLNKTDNDHSSIKPQKFSETVDNYETKLKGKTQREEEKIMDTRQTVTDDSLILTIVAAKDVRIKVYIDENRVVEDLVPAKDSLKLKAKEGFRFSALANSSVELYLNSKRLKKPSSLTSTSIKNLMINKDGIVNE